MGRRGMQLFDDKRDGFFSVCDLGSQWSLQEGSFHPGGLFASVGQVGMGAFTPNPPDSRDNGGVKVPYADLCAKYMSSLEGFRIVGVREGEEGVVTKKKNGGLKLKITVSNPSLRRLISGAIAGAVSRTAVAPLETIRTHLMVGSSGHSTTEVFHNIMNTDGWKGLFRGNLVNVIRVAPSKAIEVLKWISNLVPFFFWFIMKIFLCLIDCLVCFYCVFNSVYLV
jgi:solute carrier family 25 phosphate transporter 23/24/25/41